MDMDNMDLGIGNNMETYEESFFGDELDANLGIEDMNLEIPFVKKCIKIHVKSGASAHHPSITQLLNTIEIDIDLICNDKQINVSYENVYRNIYHFYIWYCENQQENVQLLCNIFDKLNVQQRHTPLLRDCFMYVFRHERQYDKVQDNVTLTQKFEELQAELLAESLEIVKVIKIN
jgi:hypothetical protein